MICIGCDRDVKKLERSHVIPNFFRKRMTGIEHKGGGGKSFAFSWFGSLPTKDLPKPPLLCKGCESYLGSNIERDIAQYLMPNNLSDWSEWEKLPIHVSLLIDSPNFKMHVGTYRYPATISECLDKFSISVAWRALHSMSQEGHPLSRSFLDTVRGEDLNEQVKKFIFHKGGERPNRAARLFYLGPQAAKTLSGSETQMPFAWTEIGDHEGIHGVAVLIGFWLIIWPLFEFSEDEFDYLDKLIGLEENVCGMWFGKVISELSETPFS